MAMARLRTRKRMARLVAALSSEHPDADELIPDLGLGTGNLYGEPVKRRDGSINFAEERKRIEREMRRLGLRRTA